MYRLHKRTTCLKRLSACLMAMLLPFVGLSFGEGRVEKGSSLAARIERVRKILVRTPEGETTLIRPLVLNEGIASRIRASGEELSGGGYNDATLIRWGDVREIRTRKSLAFLGALAGFGLGVAAGSVLALNAEDHVSGGQLFKGLAFFAIPASLLGAVFGSAITHWKKVYAAPAGTRPEMHVSLAPVRRGGVALSLALAF